jgi:site-specific recombinase XerD
MKSLVLDSVSSPITKRVYNMALDEFFAWYALEPRPGFTKATVSAWRVTLEERRLGSSSIIVRMSAIRKLAVEATDNGLLAPELAAGIQRVKSAKSIGVRMGNWLSQKQAQALLNAPDITTLKGLRDRAIIAVLLGCGLRRSEVAALTMAHVQQRDGRWVILDLVSKHKRVRTVPMPTWTKVAIDGWTARAGVTDGHIFRPVHRGDQLQGDRLSEKVVWQLLRPYAALFEADGANLHGEVKSAASLGFTAKAMPATIVMVAEAALVILAAVNIARAGPLVVAFVAFELAQLDTESLGDSRKRQRTDTFVNVRHFFLSSLHTHACLFASVGVQRDSWFLQTNLRPSRSVCLT